MKWNSLGFHDTNTPGIVAWIMENLSIVLNVEANESGKME